MANFSKRALKKAQTRLDILDAVYRMTATVSFRDLKTKALADEANITEMTFFNYFPKKEQTLKYMMGLWALDIVAQQYQSPLTGAEAIRRLFQSTAEQVTKHQGLMVSFISYLVASEIDPHANDIAPEDRFLLYPDLPEIHEVEIPSGNEMLLKHLQEIDATADHTDTLLHLASCFYGDVLIAHTANLDLQTLYSKSLNLILGALE